MQFSPALILHISGGTSGILSGFAAMSFRKGSRAHRLAGNVFVISMLTMCTSAMYMAFMKSDSSNFLAGTFTAYLVGTAWATGRHGDGETSLLDWGALLVVLAAIAGYVTFGVEAAQSPRGVKAGVPAGMYFFMGCIGLLAAVGDLRMLVRGGISGVQRLVRHLWRMCFGWFIASGSLFLARPHLFPSFMRKSGALVLLGVLPLILMTFWLFRVRFGKAYKRTASAYRVQEERVALRKQPLAGWAGNAFGRR
jgi:uncharacterized membrane protein